MILREIDLKFQALLSNNNLFTQRLDEMSAQERIGLAHQLSAGTERKREALLASLHFLEIERRKNTISDNAQNTFDWIYDNRISPFVRWLKDDRRLFCIFGKPGSGKSTLTRFLSDDPRTREALGDWCTHSSLIMADHYFWYPGEV